MTNEELIKAVALAINPTAHGPSLNLAKSEARAAIAVMLEELEARFAKLRGKHGTPDGPAYEEGIWDHGVRIESQLRALAKEMA